MTTIAYISDNERSSDTNNVEDINMIIQYFIPKDKKRLNEIQRCMFNNVNNVNINNIYLLNEKIYTNEELGITKCKKEDISKITQVNMKKRLTFKNVFDYTNNNNIKGYIVFCNSDIFFDSTIKNLYKSSLHKKKGAYALTRFEYQKEKNLKRCKLFGDGRGDSQDTWIIHSNYLPKKTKVFDFCFGYPGCDQKIIYLLMILGYKLYNAPFFLRTYHYHMSLNRDYIGKSEMVIQKPYGFLFPFENTRKAIYGTFINDNIVTDDDKKAHDHRMAKIEQLCNSKYGFQSNLILINYLKEKIKNKENFVIPRIAGIENRVAYCVNMINNETENSLYNTIDNKYNNLTEKQRKKIEHVIYYSGVRQNLHTMKNNAGIKIGGTYSLARYSKDYLKAFENSELYFFWDIIGNVYPGIHESHDFITKKYKKKLVNALVLDIFHYIDNPWTHTLKGKRILIVSAFIESIKEKVPIRKEIYGVDLFPDCKFVYIKPPQTQGNNNSEEYYIELDKFVKEIEKLKDSFDIALCSCGGYGNPLVNKIYEMGKSAIYVGGVLQMYFGIYGMRWMRERKEVMQLYLNKHWSRPKEIERPKGYKKVEGSAYW